MNDATIELLAAVRAVLIADDELDGVDVALGQMLRGGSSPCIVLSVAGNRRMGALGRSVSHRKIRVAVKAVAREAGGVDGLELAQEAADRALDVLTNVVDGSSAEAKLNAELDTWRAMIPLEDGSIGPYSDSAPGEADDTTLDWWHTGKYISFGLTPV